MYYLMNKNNVVLAFDRSSQTNRFSDEVIFSTTKITNNNMLPFGFKNINSWLDNRKASKHNAHLRGIMRTLGCENNEGFIRVTHAASINDTFWIKSDKENIQWEDISLYSNPFSETISKLAFEGVGLYDEVFSSTSPELSCEGSFRKCFIKENSTGENGSDIFLYKRGSEGAKIEPYCEAMASEIAKHISSAAISYELVVLHEKIASKCNLFTSEKYGFAPYAKVSNGLNRSLDNIFEYFSSIDSEQTFREMLVIDSLCFNQDRHLGNFGVLFDNDTLETVRMSPIFDLNLTLLPTVKIEEFENIGEILFGLSPRLGTDFTRIGQIAMNDDIRDKVKDIKDFKFSFRGDATFPEERVKALEEIVNRQAEAILSQDILYTYRVFFPKKEQELKDHSEKVEKAKALMNDFATLIEKVLNEEVLNEEDVIINCYNDFGRAQIFFEKGSCEIVLDFVEGKISFLENAQHISSAKLKEIDVALWRIGKTVEKELKRFIKGKSTPFQSLLKTDLPPFGGQ